MPGPDQFPVRSASQLWVAGSTLRFHSWIPRRGPNGGRLVIDGFELVADFQDINITGTAVQGADLWRAFKRIQIERAGGVLRWNLRGDESRTMCYLLEGPQCVRELPDTGTVANQVIRVAVYVPMTKRFAKDGRDFALPAELFSELRLECADVTELDDDGGVVTIDIASYYVLAWCHEEWSVRVGPDDLVGALTLPSQVGFQLPVNGRLHDLALFARGTSGGASMANFTDIRIDNLMPVAINRNDLLGQYMRDRFNVDNAALTDGAGIRQDPFNMGKAIPVLWTTLRTSVFDGPILDQAVAYLTNTVANVLALYRVVRPRDGSVVNAVAARHGINAATWRVKTEGKTKRGRNAWHPEQEAFMPLSAPLPRP